MWRREFGPQGLYTVLRSGLAGEGCPVAALCAFEHVEPAIAADLEHDDQTFLDQAARGAG